MSDMYELRVRGHLDDRLASWLGDLTIARNGDGTSTITVSAADQARLHGLLAGLRDLGAPLLSLEQVSTPASTLPTVVGTRRLRLRSGRPDDAAATWEYRRLLEVGHWLTEIPLDRDTYRATFCEPARLANTVVVELGGLVIGDFMIRVEDGWAQAEVASRARNTQAELGWVLDPRYRGQGYATEAVRALLQVSFEELGVRRVIATCFLGNESSWRLMERVGMRRETQAFAESLHRSGQWLDTVSYAMLKDEWLSARGGPADARGRQRSAGC